MLENDSEVLEAFAEESAQRLNDLERGLLEMERSTASSADLLNAMFRDAHSMKAGANLLGLRHVERAAHTLENVLDQLRAGRIASTPELCQVLLDGVDLLREILAAPVAAQDENNVESDSRLAALADLLA